MTTSVKVIVLFVLLCLILAIGGILYLKHRFTHVPDGHKLEKSVSHEIEKLRQNDENFALAVGVYKQGRSQMWTLGPSRGAGTPQIDANSRFQVGSITKVFSTLLLHQLVEEGLVRLESTLDELIGDQVVLSETAGKITLAQLASHTSGLPRVPQSLMDTLTSHEDSEKLLVDPYSHFSLKDILDYLEHTSDAKSPGKVRYSNYGMGLLVHVLEIISGERFEAMLRQRVLVPLGMENTFVELTPALKLRLVEGFTINGESTPPWEFRVLAGAGAINSSLQDMLLFIEASVDDQSALASTFNALHQSFTPDGARLGWIKPTWLDRLFGNVEVVWHNGMTGGYSAYLSIIPEQNAGVIILSNQPKDLTMLGMMLTLQARTQSWSSRSH